MVAVDDLCGVSPPQMSQWLFRHWFSGYCLRTRGLSSARPAHLPWTLISLRSTWPSPMFGGLGTHPLIGATWPTGEIERVPAENLAQGILL